MSNETASATARLLVLGGPDSGKTTYRTQLYQRIEHQPGDLRLRGSVSDLTAIEKDVERLAQGLQPLHTNINTYHSTSFAVQDRAGRQLVLEFADYDGEQVRKISQSNTVPQAWVERAQNARSWMYFLRIDPLRPERSFMTDPIGNGVPKVPADSSSSATGSSAETNSIETLQRLLFTRGASLRHPLSTPRLALLLSCWDELTEVEGKQLPSVLLEQRAPLLHRFINSNWLPSSVRVWGLSSTEQRLPETDPNRDFARRGPQHFGYVVRETGTQDRDLTLPVSWLMESR